MKFKLIATAAFALLFTACKKEEQTNQTAFFSAAEQAEIKSHTCLTAIPEDLATGLDETPPTGGAEDRAVGMKGKYWTPGSTLRVKFLNGTTALQNKVMLHAKKWELYANIKFEKVTSGNSEIRVNFSNEGSFSSVGTDNKAIPQNQKTMNLMFGNNTETQIGGTIMHEFGHALGLGHEQLSPLANIPWNKPAVYAFYASVGWPAAQVDFNIFNKFQWAQTQHTDFEKTSIMQYPVPPQFTTNGFTIGENNQLSATDKDFIKRIYSSQVLKVRHAVNTTAALTFWLNGIYHTIQPGETMSVPAKTTGNQLSIWECPNGNCAWDAYLPTYGAKYKITAVGSNGNLKLVED